MKRTKPLPSRLVYGGDYLKTRYGRSRPRPLSTRHSMHFIMRSSKARGAWSFTKKHNRAKVNEIIIRFARTHGVKIRRLGIVGNHVHLHIQLNNSASYKRFVRAVTAAVAMAVTGASRWNPLKREAKDRFWDRRPFTRIVIGVEAAKRLNDYIEVNILEGFGMTRREAQVAYFCNSS